MTIVMYWSGSIDIIIDIETCIIVYYDDIIIIYYW